MRAPIGSRISARRRALGLSQAELARRSGISASYLNLIERDKRHVGGALLLRIAARLNLDIGELTGEAEHRLIGELEEAFADPLLEALRLGPAEARDLVAARPEVAAAITMLHRGYGGAQASADDYADRLRSDPLLSQLLHAILSSVTAMRSGAEILEDTPDLSEEERRRFLGSIRSEAVGLSDTVRTLIGQFEREAAGRRGISPARQLDDLIFERGNYFARLETVAADLRTGAGLAGRAAEPALAARLASLGISIERSPHQERDAVGFPGEYHYDAAARRMWFRSSATAATRQFQLARLLGELVAADAIEAEMETPLLSSSGSRRLAFRALSSYLAGAIIFPYEDFLADAESARYDVDTLRERYSASFEQIAHRLVSLRRPGAEGVPFGFLRSDPAGRLTKHFPLPGLPLPTSGHACPRWAIYMAFRTPDSLVRQVVRFSGGARYLFIARTSARRATAFGEAAAPTSVMIACDALHADRTVYSAGLDLADSRADVPVGPACRLCTRRDCADRQEEAPAPGGGEAAVRAPLVPREF